VSAGTAQTLRRWLITAHFHLHLSPTFHLERFAGREQNSMGVMWCGERILSTRRCVALSALTTRALVPQPPTTFRPGRCRHCRHCHHLHPPLPLSPITAAATNTTTVPSSPPKPQPPPNCNAAAATTATSERHHHRHHSHRYLIPSSAPSPSPGAHLPHNITFHLPPPYSRVPTWLCSRGRGQHPSLSPSFRAIQTARCRLISLQW
jgi:hypothetical protein